MLAGEIVVGRALGSSTARREDPGRGRWGATVGDSYVVP